MNERREHFNHAANALACAIRRSMGATRVWVSLDHVMVIVGTTADRYQTDATIRRSLSAGTPEIGDCRLLPIQPGDTFDDDPEILNDNICRDGSACRSTHGFGHWAR